MNPEIENCLKSLLDHPTDLQSLRSLENLVSSGGTPGEAVLEALNRSIEQHREKGHWEALVALIDLQLPWQVDPRRQAELWALKAKVLEEELLDGNGALEAYQKALALHPSDAQSRDAIENMKLIRENWEQVVARYAEEARSAQDRRVATNSFLWAAEVTCRNAPGSDKAEEYLRRALEVEPRNWKASRHLERLLRRTNRLEDMTGLLLQRADAAATKEEKLAVVLALAELWAEDLGDPEEAVAAYRRALSLDPANEAALGYLVNTLTQQESWSALIRVYEDVLRAKPAADVEAGILVQIGLILDQKLKQAAKAEEYFRRVRKFNPTQPVMLDFYRRHYRTSGEPQKLLALLDGAQRVEGDPSRRVELTREMAKVAETEVGNVDKAIDIWKGIQRMDPRNREATSALKRLYRASKPPKWNALRELLKDELESLSDEQVDEKIRLLLEVVEIYRDHLKLDVMVINTYNSILALRPDHPQAITALTEKYESMGRWNDLIGLLLKQKEAQDDPTRQVETLHRVASLWIDKFGNQSQAIKPLEEILVIQPIEQRALDRLTEIHTKRRNWRELLELKRKEAEHRSGEKKRGLFKEIAELAATKLGDSREGILVWNKMLDQDPDDSEALQELASLYRREDRWPALAEILHRQVDAAGEAPQRTLELLQELGEIYTRRLEATDAAVDVWRRVLRLDPASAKARDVLRDLFVRQQRWTDLEELFVSREEYAELADTLSAAADRTEELELKVRLYTRVGEIYRDHLQSSERAIRSYERVMTIDPANMEVARLLAPLYREGEKWARLLASYEVMLEHLQEPDERLPILEEIRKICEVNLRSKTMAFQWCARAFVLRPEDPNLAAELERLAGEADQWEELVALYTDRVGELTDESERAALLRKLAILSEEKLGRPEDAEVFYSDLLDLSPEDQPALTALERIYTSGQRWLSLVEILNRRVEVEPESSRKVEILFRVAGIREERIGDPAGAIKALNTIANLDPDNLRSLKSLERLYQIQGEWPSLVQILARELELVETADARVEVLYWLGETLQTKLGEDDRAIGYFSQLLSLSPLHEGTVQALERYLFPEQERRVVVAHLLQPYYESTENWRRLVQVLQYLLEAEEEVSARQALLKRIMFLQRDRLENNEAAFTAGADLLALSPGDRGVRKEMSHLAEQLDRVEALAQLLEQALVRVQGEDQDHELSLSWELAQIYDDRLGQPEEVERCLRRVVEIDPSHRDAFDTLERILRDASKWLDLRSLLERRRDLEADQAARRDILLQICALNEDFLDDVPAVIRAYEEVLEIEANHGVALKALERHYTDAERWQDLLDLLRRQMDFVMDDAGLNELKLRQAELMARYLQDPQGATDLLEDVVSMDPSLDRAVALLDDLLADEALKRRITEILEAVYSRREEWGSMVRILLVRRGLAADKFEAVELLCRAASLQEQRLKDLTSAFGCYREALTLEPGALHIHEPVKRLAEELGAWAEAAETWKTAFEAADPSDIALRARLQMELARIYDERLSNIELARQAYETLLELDPHDLETARPSAVALTRLYELSGSWPELISVLRRQLGWEENPGSRQGLLIKISRIQEEVLGELQAAVATYTELLQENPDSQEALDSLERLYLQSERWKDLVEIYRRRVELARSAEERRSLWLRIAALYEEELADRDEAVAAYLTVLDETPDDTESIRALARIYRASERWTDLLEMLERELQLGVATEEERVDLIFQVATIYHGFTNDVSLALERYREVLELRPDHGGTRRALEEVLSDPEQRLTAATLLVPVYQAEGDWTRLISIYELQAQEAPPSERVRLLCKVAQLCEDGLEDLDRAFDAYRRALGEAISEPGFLDLLDQLHRIAQAQERWKDFVQVIEEVVVDVMDPDMQRTLHLNAAEVSRDHLQDLQRAKGHFQAVLDGDPEHSGALEALDALYEDLEEWGSLFSILQRRVELQTEDSARRVFLHRCAALCRERLDNPDEAIANYERVLELLPTDAQAISALDMLYADTGRWSDLAQLLQRQIETAELPERQVELCFRLGRIQADRLENPAQALLAYKEVLRLDPTHTAAIAALESYLEDPDLRVDAAMILEPYYVGRQEWQQLIRIYKFRLDAADDPERRLSLSTRIAQLHEEQLEDLEGAFSWYGKVFLEKPSDHRIREQLIRLAGILGQWEELARVMSQFLSQTLSEDETTRDVCLTLGGIYDERLHQVPESAGCYRRVLGADRSDEEAFRLLESLLTRNERWEDLLGLYREMADATLDVTERRDLLLKACRVLEEALFDMPQAIDAYRLVLEQSETDDEAVRALDRLYTETGRWQDLCDLLNRQCDFMQNEEEIIHTKFRIGNIYETELKEHPIAVDYYEEVLGRDQNHHGAIFALERMVMERDQRFRITQILEKIYREQEEWRKLVVIYDAQLEFIEDRERKVFLLREIARLHEQKKEGSLELAFRALCRAFEEEFGNPELLENIERLASRLNNWKEMVEVLARGVENVFDYDLQARIHAKIASLQEERLGSRAAAVDSWRRVLAARDNDEVAIRSLIRLLEALDRNEELIEILQRKAETCTDVTEQLHTYLRIAEIYETLLVLPDKAIDTYRQMLLIDEDDRVALGALERLYLMASNWIELIWVYQRKIDLSQDTDERRTLQLAVARVYEEKLQDGFEAINTYKTLLQDQPDDEAILNALDRLYSNERLFSDLLEILVLKINKQHDPALRIELLFRAGSILEQEIGDVSEAIERYRQVLEEDRTHRGAREALERIVSGDSHRELVAGILEQHYAMTAEVEPLVRVLELRVEAMADPPARRDLLMRIAQLQEEGLGDNRASFDALARALAEDPADETVQAELDRQGGVLGNIPELVRVYEDRLDGIYDASLSRQLHLKVARMLEEVVGDYQQAAAHYRRALEYEGDELEALLALDRILLRQQRWSDLLEILERELQAVTDPLGQAELYYRIGEIRLRQNNDQDGGFSAYRNALERNPELQMAREAIERLMTSEAYRVPVLDVLEPIYEQCQSWSKLVDLQEMRLTTLADPEERTSLLARIASLHEERLGSPDQALGAYGRALAEQPGSEDIIEQVDRLAGELSRYKELSALADEILSGELSGDAARVLGLRTAEWYSGKLNDIERAERCLKKVLEVDPTCMQAMMELEAIYRAGADFPALTDILRRQSEEELDPDRKRALLAEVARISQVSLDDRPAAIAAWRAILDLGGDDSETLDALIELYETDERWEELLGVMERRAAQATEPTDQVAIKHRMGEILTEKMRDRARALEVYRDILDIDPANGAALDRLEELFSAEQDWHAVQEILLRRLESREPADCVPVYFQLAELAFTRMESTDEAVSYYHQILDVDPLNMRAVVALEDLLRSSGKWYELVEVLRKHAEIRAADGDMAGEVEQLVAAARVWNDELQSPESAAEILEEILKRDESNVQALAGLARIYESTEQWARCQEVLERAAALRPEPRGAAELEFRMGRVKLNQSGNEEEAAAHYQRALELDPDHPEALRAMEAYSRKHGDFGKVAALLELKVANLKEEEQLKVYMELGRIYADKLDRPSDSVAVLELAQQLAPQDPEVLAPLADAYYLAERYDDAEPLLRTLMEHATRGRRKELARYTFRMGTIAEKRGEMDTAREYFDKAYKMDSTFGPTLVALGRIYIQQRDWSNARRIYRSMLLQNIDETAGISKVEIFFNLGRSHAELNEKAKALSMFERGLEVDPDHEGIKAAMAEITSS